VGGHAGASDAHEETLIGARWVVRLTDRLTKAQKATLREPLNIDKDNRRDVHRAGLWAFVIEGRAPATL